MSAIERIELTSETPAGTESFRLVETQGANYDERAGGSWAIDQIGGGLSFECEWPAREERRAGANFGLRLRIERGAGAAPNPFALKVASRGVWHVLASSIETSADAFHDRAWYIPGRLLQPGKNRILIRLEDVHARLFIQRAMLAKFKNQPQQKSRWCWSAVATNIAAYYDRDSVWNQLTVVRKTWRRFSDTKWGRIYARRLGQRKFDETNMQFFAHLALKRVGILRERRPSESVGNRPRAVAEDDMDVVWRALSFEELRRETSAMRPVVAQIRWRDGGAHFIVITGVGGSRQRMVAVQDPWGGEYKYMTYESLRDDFDGLGSWSLSCFTRPAKR